MIKEQNQCLLYALRTKILVVQDNYLQWSYDSFKLQKPIILHLQQTLLDKR